MEFVPGRVTVEDVDAFVGTLADIGAETGCLVQAFDARYVAGPRHLARAVALAERERARGNGIARDPAVEVLLYAAGRRQIDQALEMGVGVGEHEVVVVVDGEDEAGAVERVEPVLDSVASSWEPDTDRLEAFFGVTAAEREATSQSLEALVVERVALLTVDR